MRKIFTLLTSVIFFGFALTATAQVPFAVKEIRYVTKNGSYLNSGKTWADAKDNVQDAINDLANNGLTGEVWVARGTYTPTESTESNGGSTLYMSFKVPAGITVRGGFFGPGNIPGMTKTADGKVAAIHNADSIKYFKMLMEDTYVKVLEEKGVTADISNIENIKVGDDFPAFFPGETTADQRALYYSKQGNISQDKTYPYLSILSGDLSQPAKFEWNDVKNHWVPSFYGNSYHVVWFATEGFDSNGRAKPLSTSIGEAVVEGFTIMNGNARNTNLTGRPHNAYGGGVYMVQGSRLENCNVQQCEASRDGGGIYMDGGGVVRHCYINNCQSLGSGAQNGYGGGVCLETNKNVTKSLMGMYQSVVNGCVARMGGGVAIKTEHANAPDGTDLRYKPFISASAVYNNTATTEGGGIYMDRGGAIANITITRNQCNGSGVIVGGMVTGRAGGLYCRDHAVVFNSVLWGNECAANNNIQYASSQSSPGSDYKVDMRYCAVTYADYTDWSSTAKKGIFTLSAHNTKPADAAASATEVYPHFNNPTPNAGYVDIVPTGSTQTQTQLGLRRYCDWQPAVNSGLANGGIIALDLNTGALPFKSLYKDVLGNDYNPRVTLGGYTRMFGTMTATQNVDKDGDGAEETHTDEYHFFVDPNATTARSLDEEVQGVSWAQPARFLSNVLYSIHKDELDGKNTYAGKTVYIHVKEGTVNNTNSYVNDKRVREMTIGVRSDNLVILGGYPSELEGTKLEQTGTDAEGSATIYKRNPLRYPTFISGVITGEGEYEMNAAHLMQFDECENVVFDGFQIRHANASSSIFDASSTDGGAIRLINGARNITFRNLIIAGNTADRGAAVYAENGTQATFENVIIHNNESKPAGKSMTRQGIIHTEGNAELTFNHCNILNNVGYPGYLDGTSKQRYANTLFFANAGQENAEAYGTTAATIAQPSFAGSNAPLATGEANGVVAYNCLFDAASEGFATALGTTNKFDLSYTLNGDGFPRFINGVHNIGVSVGGDETFYGRATSFEPHNENPMVNAAETPEADFYAGLTLPATGVPSASTWGTTDLSTYITRNYGGLPDIGAIENHASTVEGGGKNSNPGGQQPMGSVVYVRDYHTYETELDADGNIVHKLKAEGDRSITATDFSNTHADGTPRDGSSWENAINGNGIYSTADYNVVNRGNIREEYSYKLGMRRGGSNANIYYAKGLEEETIEGVLNHRIYHSKNDIAGGDDFRLIPSDKGVGYFYIFDITHNKYVYYLDTNDGKNKVQLKSDCTDNDCIWYIRQEGTDPTYGFYYSIIPSTISNPESGDPVAWNYHGGEDNKDNETNQPYRLGLHYRNDGGSKWQILTKDIIGLQYAISQGKKVQTETGRTWDEVTTTVTETDEVIRDVATLVSTPYFHIRANRNNNSWWYTDGIHTGGANQELSRLGSEDVLYSIFSLVEVAGTPTTYKIKNMKGFWIKAINENANTSPALSYTTNEDEATAWIIEDKTNTTGVNGLGFRTAASGSNRFLNSYSAWNVGWYGWDDGCLWLAKKVNVAIENTEHDIKEEAHVYVGAGTYKGNFTMEDGVSLYGGFPGKGNPGENERNISNSVVNYMTILDGQKMGRVLSQNVDFVDSTMVEGFILKYGVTTDAEMGAGVKVMRHGIIKNCMITENTYTETRPGTGSVGGGGVYLHPGSLIKNSIISHNKAIRNAADSKDYIGGAGIFALGGVVQNSLIVRNIAHRKAGDAVLGAAMYLANKSQFYNCTIAYNFGNAKSESDIENEDTSIEEETYAGKPATGGVWDNAAAQVTGTTYIRYSTFYNCILWGNYANGSTEENVIQIGMSGRTTGGGRCFDAMQHCYSSAAHSNLASDQVLDTDGNPYLEKVYIPDSVHSGSNTDFRYKAFLKACQDNQPFIGEWNTTDFSLSGENESKSIYCINKGGNQELLEQLDITEDIVGHNRIIDCTVDKGAYEFSDSYAITPKVIYKDGGQVVDEEQPATFYVTPLGNGLASGDSPENAACAAKLQRVLDAAGRYKYQHPNQQIIVKVAQKHESNRAEGEGYFNYYATRTTDEENADVRVYSIIIPRGVEVWGGYSDFYDKNNPDNNGFYTLADDGTSPTDNRNITGNPTYFNSSYYSSDLSSDVTTYHVVSFTDRVFDGDGLPYMEGDEIGQPSSYGQMLRTAGESARESTPVPTATSTFMLMGEQNKTNPAWGGVTDRAVIDGIYITGGQANLQTVGSGSSALNINRYGGAAIVTDFAHVRNCILRENQGIFGGALALTHNALVSGCLIEQNTASYGGAIYVFEHGVKLSDGTEIKTSNDPADYTTDDNGANEGRYDPNSQELYTRWDYKMPHVYSTTIVNNEATSQGGGVWYSTDNANVRFNSTVVWANNSSDQPNVSGLYNITRPEGQNHVTTEYYPFNYCAVQNIRPAGLNNIALADDNKKGARFHDDTNDPTHANRNAMAVENHNVTDFTRYATFGYYGLTNYSILNRAGMPLAEWQSLNEKTGRNLGLSEKDFMDKPRNWENENSLPRTNIEIGARAFDKIFLTGKPMIRLFVAKPEDVDIDAALAMMNPENVSTENHDGVVLNELKEYYAQEGSSFAFPMTKLQDALDYISVMRGFMPGSSEVNTEILEEHHANNLPFEIYMGPGTYYPSLDPTGNNKNAVGSTFVIPEGVSIVGGFEPTHAIDNAGQRLTNTETSKHFLGRHRIPDYQLPSAAGWADNIYYVDRNVLTPDPTKSDDTKYLVPYSVTVGSGAEAITYTIHHADKDACGNMRHLADINANSIVEPWELEHQTILSGQLEGLKNNGVNHIVTIHADQSYVGALPHTQGKNINGGDNPYEPAERGQIIAFDGLTFTGGYAHDYQVNTVDDEHKIKYCYGGAILIDTNQYWNKYNKDLGDGGIAPDAPTTRVYQRMATPAAAGYREVPVIVNRCKFVNNTAGLGGAIASNTTLDVLNSSFEQNMASSGEDLIDYTINKGTTNEDDVTFPVSYPGLGGAIYSTYQVSAINTLFANNEAINKTFSPEKYKEGGQQYSVFTSAVNALEKGETVESAAHTILGGSGGAIMVSQQGHFHVMNCNFVRNQANAFPAIYTLNPNTHTLATTSQKQYNQSLNSVFWGNAVNKTMEALYTPEESFFANLIVNYGDAGRDDIDPDDYYKGAFVVSEPWPTAATIDNEEQFAEQVWFSAYEEDKGKKQVNNHDLRNTVFDPRKPIKEIITTALPAGKPYQNCNLKLSHENAVNEGPNFVNPSAEPGYDGYLESADWSPARLNSLTDAGWGKIKQVIEEGTYKATFVKYGDTYTENGEVKTYTVPAGRDDYSGEKEGDYVTDGAYTTMRYLKGNEKYNKTMPLGDLEYMYTTHGDGTNERVNLYRISYDPNPSHNQTYIDIGVYEYNHTKLTPEDNKGGGVDIIWVSTKEKPENGLPDGSSWSRPTSDLQRAIETLLASRNGHRKEIRLMDGTFTPIYTITATDNEEHLAFYINTKSLNGAVMKPEDASGTPINYEGIKSLTIKGGYSYELANVRNIDEYPTIIRQNKRIGGEDTNSRWNHLFYIDDPTQRYALPTAYSETDNDNGHWKDGNHRITNTFPIQFDGVTLINDQAGPDTDGAVIRYNDLTLTAGNTNPDSKITPTEAQVTTHYVSDNDYDHDVISNPAKLIISKTKIIGSGTHNFNNEENRDRSTSSAVYIGSNGGHALLYNNVFHSNYGDPLVAKCETRTINNTFARNGGLVDLDNAAGSYIRNSVLWCNNRTGEDTYGEQFLLNGFANVQSSGDIFKNNAYTGGNTESLDYSETGTIHNNNYNVGLKNENDDILYGPNFVNPENQDIEKRDFSLNASLRMLHKGSDALYDTLAVKKVENVWMIDRTGSIYDLSYQPSIQHDAAFNARRISTIDIGAYEYQYTLNRIFYVDPRSSNEVSRTGLSWAPEVVFGHGAIQDAINLAALYYQAEKKQAYVFVKGGNTSTVNLETGESLIIRDGVSLHGGINPGFYQVCEPTQTVNGVNVYDEQAIMDFVDDLYNEYEGYVGPNTHKTIIHGLKTDPYASYNTVAFTDYDSNNTNNTPNIFSLVSGFYVSATQEKTIDSEGNPNGFITEPVIDIAPQSPDAKVILRDLVVFGNDASATPGVNIANIKNALVYEALFRDNKTAADAAVLNLEENAWAASVTVEGKTTTLPTGKTEKEDVISPYNGHGMNDSETSYDDRRDAEEENRIVNSIVNYGDEDTNVLKSIREQTEKTLSGHNYRRSDHNMYYQLTEGSKHINEIPIKSSEKGNEFLDNGFTHWKQFVNYRQDRDLLGNRRLLTLTDIKDEDAEKGIDAYLDRGAFETWKVEKDTWTTGKSDGIPKKDWHFTPHSGSVVYIMEGKNLICGNDLMPGFLLLKDGASLYGNGYKVQSSFISVERYIEPEGTVMSLPFKMDYSVGQSFSDGVGMPSYANATADNPTLGALTIEPDEEAKVWMYNGSTRADWNHKFEDDNSQNWTLLTPGTGGDGQARAGAIIVPANQGVFFKPSDNITEKTLYAFTALGEVWNDNVYVETPDEKYKEVVLVQYDDRKATADNSGNTGADFTSQENMGWNCIGLPYLVSHYNTTTKDYANAALDKDDIEYNMHLPHTLWLYYDGLKSQLEGTEADVVDGDGGFYSVPSWENTLENSWHLPSGQEPRIWWGEGIFVQTAAVTDSVKLRFYLPVPPAASSAASPANKKNYNTRYYTSPEVRKDIVDKLRISVNNRNVTVYGLEGNEQIAIYDTAGRCYTRTTAGGTEWRGTLPTFGIFIIAVDDTRLKVVVR